MIILFALVFPFESKAQDPDVTQRPCEFVVDILNTTLVSKGTSGSDRWNCNSYVIDKIGNVKVSGYTGYIRPAKISPRIISKNPIKYEDGVFDVIYTDPNYEDGFQGSIFCLHYDATKKGLGKALFIDGYLFGIK